MRNLIATILIVPALAACSGSPGSGTAPNIYHLGNDYWYVPPGYRAVCENRQLQVTTPQGNELEGAEGAAALQSASNRVQADQADQVTGKRVIGMSRTTCQNAYGRWGYAPVVQGPEGTSAAQNSDPTSDVQRRSLAECERLSRQRNRTLGGVTGSVDLPPVGCQPGL